MSITDGTFVEFKEFVGIFLSEQKFLVVESYAPEVASSYELLDVRLNRTGWYEIMTRGFVSYWVRPETEERDGYVDFYDPERDDFVDDDDDEHW